MTILHHPPDGLVDGFCGRRARSRAACRYRNSSWRTVRVAALRCAQWSMSAAPFWPLCRRPRCRPAPSLPLRRGWTGLRASSMCNAGAKSGGLSDVPGLPRFRTRLSRRADGNGSHQRCICGRSSCPQPSATRVFLLKSRPGTKMIEHYPHRLRNDLRAVGKLCSCRRAFRTGRFRFRRRLGRS